MEQDQLEEAREPEGASDEAAVVAGWAAVDSERVENAYAPIAVTGLPIIEALPAIRFVAQTADRRWPGELRPRLKTKQAEIFSDSFSPRGQPVIERS
jgi:hypothetical protein